MSKYYMIDMPDGWKPGECSKCNISMCRWQGVKEKVSCIDCPMPFSTSKPLIPIKYWDLTNCAGNSKLNEKPVKLYVVEAEP